MDMKVIVDSERVGDNPVFAAAVQVEKITGNFTRTVMHIDERHVSRIVNGVEKLSVIRKLTPVKENFTEGYMLYYPQAHSIFVAADDVEQLRLLGVLEHTEQLADEDGPNVIIEKPIVLSPKELVEKADKKRSRSTVGGIEAAMAE